jgi:dihydroneopterin aldolase
MIFYGYHGVLRAEKEMGQRFIIDAVLHLDLRKAGRTDDLHDTVNYGEIYAVIKSIVEDQRFNLLEALGEAIAERVLREFPVQKIEVQIRKPSAPVVGIFDYVEVSIVRERAIYV